jgi:hypothetical protein
MMGSGRGAQVEVEWVVAIDCGCSACYELFFLTILARVVGWWSQVSGRAATETL